MYVVKGGAKGLGALAGMILCLSMSAAMADGVAPKLVHQKNPTYPKAARELKIQGSVRLEFNVDGQGNVVAPHVVKSTPPGVFDAAALHALSKWKYQALGKETHDLQVRVIFRQH